MNSGISTCLAGDNGTGGEGDSAACKMTSGEFPASAYAVKVGSTKSAGAFSGSCGDCTVTFWRSAVSACEGNRCCMHRGVSTNSDSDDCGGDGGGDGATRIHAMILAGCCNSEPPNDGGSITPGICYLPATTSRSLAAGMVSDFRAIWNGCSNLS